MIWLTKVDTHKRTKTPGYATRTTSVNPARISFMYPEFHNDDCGFKWTRIVFSDNIWLCVEETIEQIEERIAGKATA